MSCNFKVGDRVRSTRCYFEGFIGVIKEVHSNDSGHDNSCDYYYIEWIEPPYGYWLGIASCVELVPTRETMFDEPEI